MKLLLWDFDNTLAWRDGMWSQTICDLLAENGYGDIRLEQIRPFLATGFPWNEPELSHEAFFGRTPWWAYMTAHFTEILRNLGVAAREAPGIAAQIRPRYLDAAKWRVYDDVLPCLETASGKGYQNLILSNHVPELPDLARALQLDRYFIRIVSSANIGYEKPNVHFFRRALKGLEHADDAVMIGDNYHADVEGALSAGLKAVLIRKENTTGYPYYCENLNDLFNHLP